MKNSDLEGKIAIVTGGKGGLGSAIVQRLAGEGMHVASFDRTPGAIPGLDADSRANVVSIQVDVANEASVATAFDRVESKMGKPSVLVNAVGGFLPSKPLSEISLDEWNRMFDMNLTCTFLCSREAIRRMSGTSFGRIINVSAMVGIHPMPGRIPYAISKAGVTMLTDLLAQELRKTSITVNAVAPSILDTEANRQSMPDADHDTWVRPSDIADMVVWLCSEAARPFSGTTFKAFGGVGHY